jgi:hypothetical protein
MRDEEGGVYFFLPHPSSLIPHPFFGERFMSRTMLTALTAAALATASVGMMICRYRIMGDAVRVPTGPGTWKITLLVQGQSVGTNAKLSTITPLELGHQHILDELYRSDELLAKPPDSKHPERRQVLWTQRVGVPQGLVRARYQFYCSVDIHSTTPMSELAKAVYAAPHPGTQLKSEPRIQSDHVEISTLARSLTAGLDDPRDQLEVLFHFVDQEIGSEPSIPGPGRSALDCLKNGSGDSGSKSRLLVALCRNRGIPARLVTGLTLKRGREQSAHYWAEVWVHNHWLPACPSYHSLGHVPASYVVFNFGDYPLVRGRNVRDLKYAFLVERPAGAENEALVNASPLRRLLTRLSLYALPPAEQRLVEFLLLLPIAALIVCIYRNVIGLGSFGTFAPALVGLAFRDINRLPGIVVFVSIVLIGWVMRRALDRYHLLQVPRIAFLLTLVVIVLITAIVAANYQDLPATKYISLFPMVILTGMIERFWTLEVEDSTVSSFRTLLQTLMIAASISLALGLRAVVRHMFLFPETLGLIMAAQLLIGRYTGYRLSELFRFRDFLRPESSDPQPSGGVLSIHAAHEGWQI